MIRIDAERKHGGCLIRMWWRWVEVAFVIVGLGGLTATIEFPSDWHESRRAWVHLGFGLFTIGVSFPWRWVVPDEGQCSGSIYGFTFFEDGLHLRWGKCRGGSGDPVAIIQMPWGWRHRQHDVLGEPEQHPYEYQLESGEVQKRIARIKPERRVWTRPWLPWRLERHYIDIEFDGEVGERSGSWKGGCTGCSFDMLSGEAPLAALRRMELHRKF